MTITKRLIVYYIALMPLAATGQVDFFGYFENEADLLGLRDGYYNIGYNKLRLDMQTNPIGGLEIGANFITQFYYGNLGIDPRQYLPERLAAELPPADPDVPIEPIFTDTTFLDNVYLRLSKGPVDITLGRQQISTGVGYTWNPTDFFNKKNMIDPTYEQRGVEATRIDIALPLNLGFTAVIQPEGNFETSPQYYRLKSGIGAVDASASYLYESPNFVGSHDIFGLNLEGELLGIGLRTEIAVNRYNLDNDSLQFEYIIGADYTTESSIYILAEYLHNDLGLKQKTGGIMDYTAYYDGMQHSLNQNYLFLLGQYPWSDVLVIGAFTIANIDDGSIILAPDIQYSLMESVDLSATVMYAIGDGNTEFGIQELSGRIRLRAYF
jgi:hypothetical protein